MSGKGAVGERPAFHHTHAGVAAGVLELDELHGVLEYFLTGVQVLYLHGVTDGRPVVLDDYVVEGPQLHGVVPEKLAHHILVLLEGQMAVVDVVVGVRLVEGIDLEPIRN